MLTRLSFTLTHIDLQQNRSKICKLQVVKAVVLHSYSNLRRVSSFRYMRPNILYGSVNAGARRLTVT